ncbi:hypothetical protein DID88_003354 [Monilinia fructigena]|uniref:Uncharacterized protein n=1 Tax=Monilinia fructigena TaxID=38457 RepID=A0A395ITR7_9HELO|nr:hypothetical protein DID88_003354 [Monilinia fructigena]
MGKSKLRRKWWREKPGSKPASPRLDALKASEAVRRTHGSLASLPQSPPFDCLEPPLSRSIYPPAAKWNSTNWAAKPTATSTAVQGQRDATNCSIAKAKHQGLMHELCPAPAKCNGCHGPFPAGHKGCPLAPRSTAGGKPQCNLTKAQVEAIRRNNRAVQKACASGTATGTVQAMRTFQAGAQSTRSSQSTQSSTNSTAPSSTTRTPALTRVEIQVPATPREGGESAKAHYRFAGVTNQSFETL